MSSHKEVSGDLDRLSRTALRIKAERDELSAAAKVVLAYFESGELCRDTRNDHKPGWAIKQIPVVQALARLQEAIRRVESQ